MLEEQGIIYSVRGSGWFVSESKENAEKIVNKLKEELINNFLVQMNRFGYDKELTIQLLNERKGE